MAITFKQNLKFNGHTQTGNRWLTNDVLEIIVHCEICDFSIIWRIYVIYLEFDGGHTIITKMVRMEIV